MSDKAFAGADVLVLSGGLALGAFQAGVFEGLSRHDLAPKWVAGTSIGALNAAIIAGNAPDCRVDRLKELWKLAEHSTLADTINVPISEVWRHQRNWLRAIGARIGGNGLFRLRFPFTGLNSDVPSIYDNGRLRTALSRLIDFDRLNKGEMRLTIVTTDIETGEAVVFDTHCGDRIEVEHLMASGGLPPDFSPVRIEERTLGDGGLVANTPIQIVIERRSDSPLRALVVDLFQRRAPLPKSLEAASTRRADLLFANQTWNQLDALKREFDLRDSMARLATTHSEEGVAAPERSIVMPGSVSLYLITLEQRQNDAGDMKIFDFSRQTLNDRWSAGLEAIPKLIDLGYGTSRSSLGQSLSLTTLSC